MKKKQTTKAGKTLRDFGKTAADTRTLKELVKTPTSDFIGDLSPNVFRKTDTKHRIKAVFPSQGSQVLSL